MAVEAIKQTLEKFNAGYIECKTWTTDGFFRDTPEMINYRKDEGCSVVEMERAAMAAVSEFRSILFGQLLYSGDILADFNNYDERNWFNKFPARKKLFTLAVEAVCECNLWGGLIPRPLRRKTGGAGGLFPYALMVRPPAGAGICGVLSPPGQDTGPHR
jgi:hypothetical protein